MLLDFSSFLQTSSCPFLINHPRSLLSRSVILSTSPFVPPWTQHWSFLFHQNRVQQQHHTIDECLMAFLFMKMNSTGLQTCLIFLAGMLAIWFRQERNKPSSIQCVGSVLMPKWVCFCFFGYVPGFSAPWEWLHSIDHNHGTFCDVRLGPSVQSCLHESMRKREWRTPLSVRAPQGCDANGGWFRGKVMCSVMTEGWCQGKWCWSWLLWNREKPKVREQMKQEGWILGSDRNQIKILACK